MSAAAGSGAFLTDFSKAVDSRNGRAVAAFFAADGVFVFANLPPMRGPVAIAEGNDQFFGAIAALRHEIEDVWEVDDRILARLSITYTRHDGSRVTLPGVNIIRRGADGKIAEFQAYIDVAPVFAVPAQATP